MTHSSNIKAFGDPLEVDGNWWLLKGTNKVSIVQRDQCSGSRVPNYWVAFLLSNFSGVDGVDKSCLDSFAKISEVKRGLGIVDMSMSNRQRDGMPLRFSESMGQIASRRATPCVLMVLSMVKGMATMAGTLGFNTSRLGFNLVPVFSLSTMGPGKLAETQHAKQSLQGC